MLNLKKLLWHFDDYWNVRGVAQYLKRREIKPKHNPKWWLLFGILNEHASQKINTYTYHVCLSNLNTLILISIFKYCEAKIKCIFLFFSNFWSFLSRCENRSTLLCDWLVYNRQAARSRLDAFEQWTFCGNALHNTHCLIVFFFNAFCLNC